MRTRQRTVTREKKEKVPTIGEQIKKANESQKTFKTRIYEPPFMLRDHQYEEMVQHNISKP